MFGSYDGDLHPRVSVIREGLAANGWDVEELNAPLGASTADKVAAAGSAAAGLRLVGRMVRSWVRLVRGRRTVRRPDVVVVGYLGHLDVHLARRLFPGSTLVLDHLVGLADTVADRGLGGSLTRRLLRCVDDAATATADLVVVDTELQAAELPVRHRSKAVVVPVGAGDAWRAARHDRAPEVAASGDTSLSVVFFGLFTPLQGTRTIGEAIALLADDDVTFTMIGDGQDRAAARTAAGTGRARWLEWESPSMLPTTVAAHDVCLGVFGTGPKTRRVVPTKVYQGLAAGCAVVTADTPATADLLGDAVAVVPPGDAAALADTLRELRDDPARLADLRDRATRAAERFRPERATAALDARLLGTDRRRPPLPALTLNAWLRWDVVRRELPRRDARTVLEIGPGEGAVACRLAEGRRYTGVETSARTREITARRLQEQGRPATLVASLDELGPQETFDLVCAFEVLEHIDDDAAAFASWAERVAPGGRLLVSTPAGPDRMGPHDRIAGHLRRYRGADLARLAADAGLTDVRVVHVGFPAGYALEAVRNVLAARRLAAEPSDGLAADALTEASSSILQPPRWSGPATLLLSAPARLLQRAAPTIGTGLVLIAERPA